MTIIPTWNASYETGDTAIDRQHRQLLALIDRLQQSNIEKMTPPDILGTLDEAVEFTYSHFDMEEALMVRVEYPPEDQLEMIRQHREFRDYIRLRVLEFRASGPVEMERFRTYLTGWLTGHEFGLDRKLADWIRTRQQRMQPASRGA